LRDRWKDMENNPYRVPGVERVIDILEYLSEHPQSSLTNIYQDLGLAKSTTYGIVLTLIDRGYIRKDVSGGFYLGLKLYELGIKAKDKVDYAKEALPILNELAQKTGFTSHFGVLEGDVGVYLEKVDSSSSIRLNSWKGKRIYLHCTSLGKVLLAYRTLPEIIEVLERISLEPLTNKTITDKETLLSELLQVKKNGFAVDAEENEADITCIAAPVFDYAGKIVGAVSISGLTSWITPQKKEELVLLLKSACKRISEHIGAKKNE